MTTVEMIAQIRSELVEPVQGFWTDEEILLWLNRGLLDYVSKTRVLEAVDFTSTQSGIGQYPLPQNCLSVRALFLNIATPTVEQPNPPPNWRRLTPSNLEKNAQQSPNFTAADSTQIGMPGSYMIWGKTLYLFPIPNTNGSSDIMMFFKSKPIPVTLDGEPTNLDDTLHDSLIAYVLWKAFKKEKEHEQAAEQKAIYDGFILEGRRWTKKQSGDQRYRLDVSSPIPFEGPSTNIFNPLQ